MNNFVFFLRNEYEVNNFYFDIKAQKNVQFILKTAPFKSRLLNTVFRMAFSQKLNNLFRMRIKRLFFKKIMNQILFEKNSNLILIFHAGWYDKAFFAWIKKKYPEVIKALYFDDTIQCYSNAIKSMCPDEFKKYVDLIFCYNPEDVKRFDFIKCSAFFAKKEIVSKDYTNNADLAFVGQPKDRQLMLEDVYDYLSKNGCNCNFILVNAEGSLKGIKYTNQYLQYDDYYE